MGMYSVTLVEFSIARGGLFYRLQERLRLVNKNDTRVAVRAVIFALICWLPLVIFAATQGLVVNEDQHRSLLLDFPVYARFLIAVPLFVVAENLADDRYVMITSYIFNSGIVPENERPAYRSLLTLIQRLVAAPPAEMILFILAYLASGISVFYDLYYGVASWKDSGTDSLSFAGWWYLLVSAPLFLFLLFRWIWRLMIWCIFLWRFSRLNLRLVATHPDSAGGLGILAESINAFAPILFSLSGVVSAVWCERVVFQAGDVAEFHRPFLAFLVVSILISIAPLMIFTGRLIELKLHGLHDYGVLANSHSLLFDEKWIRQAEKNMGSVLGTPDISSLCDLSADYQTVQTMKLVPFRLQNLAFLAAAVFVPMIPLLLIEIPLTELLIKFGAALL